MSDFVSELQFTEEPALEDPALLLGLRLHRPYRSESLAEHLRIVGPLSPIDGNTIISLVGEAGLLGRGGAGFPTARKLASVASQRATAFVVANGAESEPASRKDRTLLQLRPHVVLDGAVLAARAVGAEAIALYIHDNDSLTSLLQRAIQERRASRLDEPPITLSMTSQGFVSGESTSIVSFLNGGPAKPLFNQRNSRSGVGGRPTLVQNVETLAHLAQIIRFGPSRFRGLGTSLSPGTFLSTLTGAVPHPGRVIEVARTTTIGTLLETYADIGQPPQALLLGGYGGVFVNGQDAWDWEYSRESLAHRDASLGCGLIGVVPHDVCGLAEATRIMRYLADQTAGQCGPCVYGLDGLATILHDAATGRVRPRVLRHIESRFEVVEGRGACAHPDAAVAFMRSALTVFATEVDAHRSGRCTASTDKEVFDVPRTT
jgi:NADH:ubiquinone oxidoreductase subunit F (NADH-binding)